MFRYSIVQGNVDSLSLPAAMFLSTDTPTVSDGRAPLKELIETSLSALTSDKTSPFVLIVTTSGIGICCSFIYFLKL